MSLNGKIEEHHYCAECNAEFFGSMLPAGFLNTNEFGNLLTNLFGGRHTEERNLCPNCGSSLAEISSAGRMGCAECYSYFARELEPYLSRIHGSATHTGKVPKSVSPKRNLMREAERLKKELNEAVVKQEYEQAAKLRDRLKELEGGETK
jgi:protein arginine kinase activator